MTAEDVLALPENGGYEDVTDPVTGETMRRARSLQFLVNDSDVYAYRIDGTHWFVGRGVDGQLYRERRGIW